MHDFMEENVASGRSFLFWAILIGLVIIGATFVHYWLQPTWLGYERKAFTESHQYVEARKTEILSSIEQHAALEAEIAKYKQSPDKNAKIITGLKNQKKALENKIRAALKKIPRDAWPEGTERF